MLIGNEKVQAVLDQLRSFRRLKAAHDALIVARKASSGAWDVGAEGIDFAIDKTREEMLSIVEQAVTVDWCHPSELAAPIAMLDEAHRMFGPEGAVAQLGVRVGELFKIAIVPPQD